MWYTGIAVVKLYVEFFRIAKFHEVTNLAIEAAINVHHEGRDTPRTRLLDSIALVLDRLSEKDWDLDKEMIGWELGGSPVRLLLCCLWKKFGTMISVKMFVAFSLKDCTAYNCRPRCLPEGANLHPRLAKFSRF